MAGMGPYMDFLSDFNVYHNNFTTTADLDLTNDWTLTTTGTTPTATLSDDLSPSHLILTNSAADNDSAELQFAAAGGTGEGFYLVDGKKLYFETRFRLTDANNNLATVQQADLFVGLSKRDTEVIDGSTDFIGFSKVDASGVLNFVCGKNASASGALVDKTVTAVGKTLVAADANTWVKVGFLADGLDGVYIYLNNVHTASMTTATNLCDDENMCVTFAIQNGEAVAKIMHIDYVLVAHER